MKITIELTEAEVKGIKAYLKEVGDIEKPNKDDIKTEIQGIISSYLQSPQCSLADYVTQYTK